ncbi:MAG: hypothetical protein HC886_22705 [Leptolyngbyaceae cyanobacterium SM1_1_3]|nr:hypothetical protein [Leptolyngbyaceae cyanobacterium SM1_1_3]NJM84910.1 hypothetical protein [Leptolyngbyaceae cyanobacterium RM2_2_21]NJN03927.1 hypothetical protein [Leptolyngbyaceae cyanobacterium RM1_1_2]NJO11271.1 hypothetical protein [Leptolyngbyaceae cyanobacterium SL_1_1]
MREKNRSTLSEWLKGLSLIAIILASVAVIVGAVNFSPVSGQAGQVESEVLAKQLEFILKLNSAFLGFLGIIGALLTWFFKSSLEDAKKITREIVRNELIDHIEPFVKEESDSIKRLLKTEQIIRDTTVYYYLASNVSEKPLEYKLLDAREFDIKFFNQAKKPKRQLGNVFVLDVSNTDENIKYLETQDNTPEQDECFKLLEKLIELSLAGLIGNKTSCQMPIIVVYVRPGKRRITLIDRLKTEFTEVKYYTSANTPVALMGCVVDSAYVAYGDRLSNRSH